MATQNNNSTASTERSRSVIARNEAISSKESKSLIPKLRFKEFEYQWEKKKLSHLIKDLKSGISVNSEDRPIENNLEFGILKTSSVVNGIFIEPENKKIIDSEVSRAKLNPTKNEIIISRMNTPQLVGESGYIDKTYHNLFIPDRLWQTVTYKERCHNKWLSIFLITDRIRYNLKSIATGTSGTMKNISKPNFLSIKVHYPKLPEQQKIANFLTAVDTKLQQLTTKKEKLAQYKKGVMQQLFSQQLRFKDDNGSEFPDWEENKLGEICTFFSGGTPTSTNKEYYSGTIPFIGSGNIYNSEVFNFISEEAFNSSSAKIVKKGDLLYALYGANSGEVSISKLNGAINQAVLCIRTKESIEYLYYVLLLNKDKITTKYLQGGQGNLSSKIIKNLKYKLPSLKEQEKIAAYLSALDTKIEKVETQISNTQAFKKGLLQQLFV